MNDLLTSDILPNTEFSKFNLLVFEASNWYKVDPKILYRKEHNNFKWGLHKQCDFVYNFDKYFQD